MLEGGWYRANLVPDRLTLLVFNSLQFNDKSQKNGKIWLDTELEWLEE